MRVYLLVIALSASLGSVLGCQSPPKERKVRSAEDLEQASSGQENAEDTYDDDGPFEQDQDM